jgi:hypothetical protein
VFPSARRAFSQARNGQGTLTFHEDVSVRGFRCEFWSHAGANCR